MLAVRLGRRTWIAGCAGLLVAGCRPAPASSDPEAVASRYIQLTRELAKHDPSLIDHWLTEPPPDDPRTRRPVSSLHLAIDALAKDAAAAVPETSGEARPRAEWLAGQARALRLAAERLLGESLPFDTETRQAFGITAGRADRFQADRALEQLARLLPGDGPLLQRLAHFRSRFQIHSLVREAVLRAALDVCRETTQASLRLPDDEAVEVQFVDGLPWDAHARYLGGHRTRIEVNASVPLDLTRALRLACHEGYAGHHAQHIWVADEVVSRRGWTEQALVPGFGPALLLAEGAAELGAALAMPAGRRAEAYRDRLLPASGLERVGADDLARLIDVEEAQAALEPLIVDIARAYLDNEINATAAIERLEQEVLMPGAETFLHFIERRRTRVLAYTEGRRLAEKRLGSASLARLRALFVP